MCDLEELAAAAPALPEPTRRLDNRGRACAGFVHTRRMLDAMEPGGVLEPLRSDRFSWWELPAWLEVHGHELLSREQAGRLWWRSYRFVIRKRAAAVADRTAVADSMDSRSTG